MEPQQIPIPDFLLNCPEFNSDQGSFHVNDIKCPITRKKVKEYYKIPEEDDEETKKRKFDEFNQTREHKSQQIQQQQAEISELKAYISQQNEVLQQIIEKLNK